MPTEMQYVTALRAGFTQTQRHAIESAGKKAPDVAREVRDSLLASGVKANFDNVFQEAVEAVAGVYETTGKAPASIQAAIKATTLMSNLRQLEAIKSSSLGLDGSVVDAAIARCRAEIAEVTGNAPVPETNTPSQPRRK